VDLASATPSIQKGVQAGAQCTIEVAHTDFIGMLSNPALGMQLFMQGKLRVSGDPMLAMKLQKLFSLSAA
jgi:putative sterol carrier protein